MRRGGRLLCNGIGGMAEKVIDGVTGLHFRHEDHGALPHVMEGAANAQTYAQLTQGIPAVRDEIEIARSYLKAFGLAEVSPEPPRRSKSGGTPRSSVKV